MHVKGLNGGQLARTSIHRSLAGPSSPLTGANTKTAETAGPVKFAADQERLQRGWMAQREAMIYRGVLLGVGEGLAWAYNVHHKNQKLEKVGRASP